MEEKKENNDQQGSGGIAMWLPIGMCLGSGWGLLMDNLALGIALGMLFGVALGNLFGKKKEGEKEKKEEPEQ